MKKRGCVPSGPRSLRAKALLHARERGSAEGVGRVGRLTSVVDGRVHDRLAGGLAGRALAGVAALLKVITRARAGRSGKAQSEYGGDHDVLQFDISCG